MDELSFDDTRKPTYDRSWDQKQPSTDSNSEDFFSQGTSTTAAMRSLNSATSPDRDDAGFEQTSGSPVLETLAATKTIKMKKSKKKVKKVEVSPPVIKRTAMPTPLEQSPGEMTHSRLQERSYSHELFDTMLEQERSPQQGSFGDFHDGKHGQHVESWDTHSRGSNKSKESRKTANDDDIRKLMTAGVYRRSEPMVTLIDATSRKPPSREGSSLPGTYLSGSQNGGSVSWTTASNAPLYGTTQYISTQDNSSHHTGSHYSNDNQFRNRRSHAGQTEVSFTSHESPFHRSESTPQAYNNSYQPFPEMVGFRGATVVDQGGDFVGELDDDLSVHSDLTGLTGAFAQILIPESDSLTDEEPNVPALAYPKYDAAASKFAMMEAMNKAASAAGITKKMKNRPLVRFGTVQIRSFERILGDNPSTISGAPIGIGWKFVQFRPQSVNEFEERRLPTRPSHSLVLNRDIREEMLVSLGYSKRDIAAAIRTNLKCRNKRRQTVQNLRAEGVEEKVESAVKGVMRMFGR